MTTRAKQVAKPEKGSFVFICLDGEGTAALRRDNMFGHLDHIEKYNHLYRAAGPIKNEERGIWGSFFMVAADTEAEAHDVINGDPYVECGLFKSIEILPVAVACGELLGGVTWDQDQVRADIEKYI